MASRDTLVEVVLVALHFLTFTNACIYKYGTAPDSLVPPHGGTHWTYARSGDDWVGEDASGNSWTCKTGRRQSPVNVPGTSQLKNTLPSELRTRWHYPPLVSNGSNIEVINNGHAIQVEWLHAYEGHVDIAVPAPINNNTKITSVLNLQAGANHTTVSAKPVQFHFHTTSEHVVSGRYFPLEMHIVNKLTGGIPACANGCITVTGILFELCETCPDNELLAPIWSVMPTREGQIVNLTAGAKIELERFFGKALEPHPPYVTYEGSLTTPPCTEGLLWHVVLRTQNISVAQWIRYKEAVAFKECELKNATSTASHGHHRRLNRHMLQSEASEEHAGNPDDYKCSFASYGSNFRTMQPLNSRVLKAALTP